MNRVIVWLYVIMMPVVYLIFFGVEVLKRKHPNEDTFTTEVVLESLKMAGVYLFICGLLPTIRVLRYFYKRRMVKE